jgi:hypothetical protein
LPLDYAFDNTFTLQRTTFAIGEGAWTDFGIVANEILMHPTWETM